METALFYLLLIRRHCVLVSIVSQFQLHFSFYCVSDSVVSLFLLCFSFYCIYISIVSQFLFQWDVENNVVY